MTRELKESIKGFAGVYLLIFIFFLFFAFLFGIIGSESEELREEAEAFATFLIIVIFIISMVVCWFKRVERIGGAIAISMLLCGAMYLPMWLGFNLA